MKLRTQIIGFGIAGIGFTGVAGGIGWFAAGRLGGSIEQAIQAGQALRLSLLADMMHDAIRADDQRAMLGAIDRQPEQIVEAEKDLAEHTRKFDAALVELQTLPLSAKSRHALDAARTLAAAYFSAARQVVADAQRDTQAMQRSAAAMQDSFGKLETAMECPNRSSRTAMRSRQPHWPASIASGCRSLARWRSRWRRCWVLPFGSPTG